MTELRDTTPTDQDIDRAFGLALIENGDQGEAANLIATVAILRERIGWDEDEADAVYRCGVQVYGWKWNADDLGGEPREWGAQEREHEGRVS